MKKVLLSFGDSRLARSANRIKRQAQALGLYEKIVIADEEDLSSEFHTRFADKLTRKTPGFGYWCWKPQIVFQTLATMADGDILHYVDIGCHLNLNGRSQLETYFERVSQTPSGIVGFQFTPLSFPITIKGHEVYDFLEFQWTKGDLFDYFAVRQNNDIVNTEQISATTFFIKKNPNTMAFATNWLNTVYDDFSLLDDTPSRSINFPGFIEHRRDQSIWSILCKMNGVETISAEEIEGFYHKSLSSSNADCWGKMNKYPIQARRDRGFSLFRRILNKLNRFRHN